MTKKQHYVPQFYLRNFTSDDNKLWVFDRVKEEYYFQTPKEICYEKYLYETPWEDANQKLGKYVLEKRVWLTEEFDGSRLAPRILEMNYTFLVSNGEPFITSSFPAIYGLCDTEERGLMPGNIYLPVHPQIALLYNGTIPKMKSNRLKTVGEEIVQELNSVYLKSDVAQMRFLIARDKESLRTVIEKEH